MAGLPDGRNSVFTEPTLAGERAARRLINTITYESAEFLRLRHIALTHGTSDLYNKRTIRVLI